MTTELERNEHLDSDSERHAIVRRHMTRAGLVAAGGVIGTLLREVISRAIPDAAGLPVGIFAINILGAFALGLLLELLALRGPDSGWRRNIRLLVGTGVLGGFTTYSTLAVGTAMLLDSRPLTAVAYALGTVVLGVAGSGLGILVGRLITRREPEAQR